MSDARAADQFESSSEKQPAKNVSPAASLAFLLLEIVRVCSLGQFPPSWACYR